MKQNSFSYEQLIDCSNGDLFGKGNAQLPSPPMLMFDRITNIQETKGKFDKGIIECVRPEVAPNMPAKTSDVGKVEKTNTSPIQDVPRNFGKGKLLSDSNGVRL